LHQSNPFFLSIPFAPNFFLRRVFFVRLADEQIQNFSSLRQSRSGCPGPIFGAEVDTYRVSPELDNDQYISDPEVRSGVGVLEVGPRDLSRSDSPECLDYTLLGRCVIIR
jgi:hypothetical protein